LVSIQATMSKIHIKSVLAYQRFYNEIGTNTDNTPLMMYYFNLPRHIKHYDKPSFSQLTLGSYWIDGCD